MFPPNARGRAVGAVVFAAGCFALAIPSASATPIPEPQIAVITGCPIDVQDFFAQLPAAGFTSQAANVVTQLTDRDCPAAD